MTSGVNVNVRDNEGMTPSMWACRMDHIEHFELLSHAEQHIEEEDGLERDCNGKTWMHWSVKRAEPLECLRVSNKKHGQGVIHPLNRSQHMDCIRESVNYGSGRMTEVGPLCRPIGCFHTLKYFALPWDRLCQNSFKLLNIFRSYSI